MTAVDAFV